MYIQALSRPVIYLGVCVYMSGYFLSIIALQSCLFEGTCPFPSTLSKLDFSKEVGEFDDSSKEIVDAVGMLRGRISGRSTDEETVWYCKKGPGHDYRMA